MQVLYVVAAVAAIACVPLLVTILIQLADIRTNLQKAAEQTAKGQRAADRGQLLDRMSASLESVLVQLRQVEEGVASISTRREGAAPEEELQDRLAPGAPPAEPALRTQGVGPTADGAVLASSESADAAAVEPERRDEARHAATREMDTTSATSSSVQDLVEGYRRLIAQPRKAEIKRWFDERGGEFCDVAEDGSFQTGRESNGLLALVPVQEGCAVVLPGGRLVVDFATSFANPLSLRSVTRQTFDLLPDGSGVLRLMEPAYAQRRDGVWRLVRAGRLAGLTGD